MADRERTVSEDDLARLKRAREDADGRYNAALTELDAAIVGPPDLPHPPPLPDETQVTPLNTRWEIMAARPATPGGWRGRLARVVWSLVEPVFATQQAFNSALVDHVNRNIGPQREIPKAIGATIALQQQQIGRLIHFQSRLIAYLQQVTPYVDTKDYEFAALARRIAEDAQEELDLLDRTTRGLAGSVSAVSDALLQRSEAFLARDERYSGQMESLRAGVAIAQQQVAALKREVSRGVGATRPADAVAASSAPATDAAGRASGAHEYATSMEYVGFEDLFRGAREDITERQQVYVPLFENAADVLDVGCGRGEFLDLLAGRGIRARGLDSNHEMAELCRARGLDVVETDALTYLGEQPDASLGGMIALQVVEHLEPKYLVQVLDQAQRVLKPGAPLVLETINVACWTAFFESYIRDITHVRPLHPDTLKYLVTASGFADASVQFSAPVEPAARLQPVPQGARTTADPAVQFIADAFDSNVERLNRVMFTHLDYAVIARRP